jgi:hypothetical protein
MPRIIVTADTCLLPDDAAVLLDEQVRSVHLSTHHAASQLVERLAWAVSDAEAAEGARVTQSLWPRRRSSRVPLETHAGARLPAEAARA